MALIKRGDIYYLDSPSQFETQAFSATPKRVTLKSLVPRKAEWFRVVCALYRGVADAFGNTDVSGICRLPGSTAGPNFAVFGSAVLSGNTPSVPAGTLVESLGATVEIPNVFEGVDWAVFYWLHVGNTMPGAQITLQLASYKLAPTYVWPPRPLKNAVAK